MFCSNCGAQNQPGARFCLQCGAPLGQPVMVQPAQEPEKKERKGCIWAGIAGGALLILGIVLFWLALIPVPVVSRRSALPQPVVQAVNQLHILQQNLDRPDGLEALQESQQAEQQAEFYSEATIFDLEPVPLPAWAQTSDVLTDYGDGGQTNGDGGEPGGPVDDQGGDGGDGGDNGDGGNTQTTPGENQCGQTADHPLQNQLYATQKCGPAVDLAIEEVFKRNVWTLVGNLGFGPMEYVFSNAGESMADGEYGYHTVWYVRDGEDLRLVDDKWFSCTGWDDNDLRCMGPDWQKYGYAEMYIYYDDPNCPAPIASFIFQGEDPLPATNCDEDEVCIYGGNYHLTEVVEFDGPQDTSEFALGIYHFEPNIHDGAIENPEAFELVTLKYIKSLALFGHPMPWIPSSSGCWSDGPSRLACVGFLHQGDIRPIIYELYQKPRDLCPTALSKGVYSQDGGVVAQGEGDGDGDGEDNGTQTGGLCQELDFSDFVKEGYNASSYGDDQVKLEFRFYAYNRPFSDQDASFNQEYWLIVKTAGGEEEQLCRLEGDLLTCGDFFVKDPIVSYTLEYRYGGGAFTTLQCKQTVMEFSIDVADAFNQNTCANMDFSSVKPNPASYLFDNEDQINKPTIQFEFANESGLIHENFVINYGAFSTNNCIHGGYNVNFPDLTYLRCWGSEHMFGEVGLPYTLSYKLEGKDTLCEVMSGQVDIPVAQEDQPLTCDSYDFSPITSQDQGLVSDGQGKLWYGLFFNFANVDLKINVNKIKLNIAYDYYDCGMNGANPSIVCLVDNKWGQQANYNLSYDLDGLDCDIIPIDGPVYFPTLLTIDRDKYCYSGPNSNIYPPVDDLFEGEVLPVVGKSEDGYYYVVQTVLSYTTGQLGQCWVYKDGTTLHGQELKLQVIAAPPPPVGITPTATQKPPTGPTETPTPTTKPPSVPKPPTNIEAYRSGDYMDVSWDESEGATYYVLEGVVCQEGVGEQALKMIDFYQETSQTWIDIPDFDSSYCPSSSYMDIYACNNNGCSDSAFVW